MIATTPNLGWYDGPGGTKNDILETIKTSAAAKGWTVAATVAATETGTFTGLPSDGQTATIDGVVYTAKNSPGGGNEWQIGANATECATNFAAKINATHTTVTASSAGAVVTLSAVTAGPTGNGIALSKTMSNFTWATAALKNGGYKLNSALTGSGIGSRIYLFHQNGTHALWRPSSVDESAVFSGAYELEPVASRRYRVRVTDYDLHFYVNGTSVARTAGGMGVPWLTADMTGTAITNVTDDGTGKIKITAPGHGRVTGNQAFIAGVIGVTIAPNPGTLTVIDADNFTIDGSSFSGAYVSGGRVGGSFPTPATRKQLSRAIWACGNTTSVGTPYFRGGTGNANVEFHVINENVLEVADNQNAALESVEGPDLFDEQWEDLSFFASPALFKYGAVAAGTFGKTVGGLWQALWDWTSLVKDSEDNLPAPGSERFFVYGTFPNRNSLCLLVPPTITTL